MITKTATAVRSTFPFLRLEKFCLLLMDADLVTVILEFMPADHDYKNSPAMRIQNAAGK